MAQLNNKIDFALVFSVRNANPNGDPLDGNRPRTTYEGLGEVSDVCLKRKLRNRLQDMGQAIFVQSDDRRVDEFRSLHERADGNAELKAAKDDRAAYARKACESWYDVRAFGQVFAFKKSADKGKGKGKGKADGDEETAEAAGDDAISIGVRGPVTIQSAFSTEPVDLTSLQITKSVNLETQADPDKRGNDTMGMKHRVDFGIYVTYGSINVQCALKTGFSEEDAALLKEALRTIFHNDATAARPDGSMEVVKLIWWRHSCAGGQYSAAKVHRTLRVEGGRDDIKVWTEDLPGLTPEMIDGE